MQVDAKHMNEVSFIHHLLMAGDSGGARKCNSVPSQKRLYLREIATVAHAWGAQ